MSMLAVLLALSPVIVILLLLVLRRTPANVAGIVGWICTVLVAWLYFQTPWSVTLRASLSRIVASLPIALPAIGYDALTTYALLGIPVVVFAGFVGLPVNEAGTYFARFMPVISTCIALGMLWLVGRWAIVRRGLVPALITGLTAGFVCIGMNIAGMDDALAWAYSA